MSVDAVPAAPGRRALSIRARITVGTIVVATVLFTLAAVLFYQVVSSIVDRSERTLLASIGAELEREIDAGGVPSLDASSNGQLYLAIPPDGDGRESSMPARLTLLVAESAAREDGSGTEPQAPRFEEIEADSARYLVRIDRVDSPAGQWTLATARDQAAAQLVRDDFAHVLVYAAIFLVVTFALASWILTGAALAPVRRMRTRAERLSAGPTGAGPVAPGQLPVLGTHDEIDELAVTLNAFLTRQRESVAREKQMVSDASHELRTPLAALSAQLEIAHRRVADPEAVGRVIGDARSSVDRLVRLAGALLDISRIESASVRAATPFAELVEELVGAVDRTRLIAGAAGVEIDYDIDERDPGVRYGVLGSDFGRVIDNLVRNAIQVSPAGATVGVLLRQDGDTLRLRVHDDGAGMPEAFLPVAFDRFSRPDDSRTSASGGSGLGLALVHTTVVSAGGAVALANRAGGGLDVDIELPALPSAGN